VGGVPKNHRGIPDELVDGPALSMKRRGQRGEMARDLMHQTVGIGCLGNACKIRDVGKQDGDLPPGTAELDGDGANPDPGSRLAPTRGRRWQSDHWPEPGLSPTRWKGRPATTGRRCCAEQGAPGVDGCCCGRRSSPPSVTGAEAQTVDSLLSDWNNSEIGESWGSRSASYRDRFFSLKTPLGPNT
jgi:hypothetical protein